jgi:hypothetical protein
MTFDLHSKCLIYDVSITFVKREGNVVAHRLAKIALTIVMDHTWREEIPNCIFDTVACGSFHSSCLILR